MTDCWHIPLIRVIKIWQEVETTWKDALLIASATNSEQAWRDLAAYQVILTTVEKWMIERWEIARPDSDRRLHRVVARSRQYRASRRLLYGIAVASEGGMQWWTVLDVERDASAAEVRTVFDSLLKRYHKKPIALLIAMRMPMVVQGEHDETTPTQPLTQHSFARTI
jgi:hypothetical protein